MKKFFFTGLALLLPAVITIVIIVFLVNVITNPLLGIVSSTLNRYDLFNAPFLFLNGQQVLFLISKLTILLGLFLSILFIGVLANWFFVHYFVKFSEFIIYRIPFINKIYKGVQDVVLTLFGKQENSFSEVVLVPFPHANACSIGLVTSKSVQEGSDPDFRGLVSVLVPGTPNPAMGFMLLFKREQLIPIDMTVQDAMKFVVSCGVIVPEKTSEKL